MVVRADMESSWRPWRGTGLKYPAVQAGGDCTLSAA